MPDTIDRPATSARAEAPMPSLARRMTLLASSSLTVMAGATIAPSLPELARHFADITDAEFLSRLVVTLPALAIALSAPLAGFIIDRFGRKRLLLVGLLAYALAGTSGLWLETLGGILIGRALLGITIGAVMTTCVTLISDYFSGPARERFLAIQTAFMAYGGVVYLALGGMLAELHWRGPFALYALAALLAPIALMTISEPDRHAAHAQGAAVPLPGGALARFIAGLYALVFVAMIAFYLVPVQMPFHLNAMGVASPGLIGLAIALSSLAGATGSLALRRIMRKITIPGVLACAYGLSATGFALVALAPNYIAVVLALVVLGVGTGMGWPCYSMLIASRAPPALRGRLFGGMTTSLFLGQFTSPLVAQPIVDHAGLAGVFAAAALMMAVLSAGFAPSLVKR